MNVCLFCSKPLFGRADKKYCDVQCKNSFHNEHLKKKPSSQTKILQQILQNRIHYELLLGEGVKKEISYQDLENLGVDINFFTHVKKLPGIEIRCCFEFALFLSEQKVRVERMKESFSSVSSSS